MKKNAPVRLGATLLLLIVPFGVRAETRVVLEPGGRDVGTAYVVTPIRADLEPGQYTLAPEGDGTPVAAVIFKDGGKTYLGAVVPGPSGERRDFSLQEGAPEGRPAVRITPDGQGEFTVRLGDEVVTRLVQGETKPYLYPLIGPTGEPITRAYPMEEVEGEARDHNHQRSFWFTHGDVNGYDFWGSDPLNKPSAKSGTIRQTSAQVLSEAGAVGVLRTTDDWLAPDGSKVCEDVRTLRVFAGENPRVLDFDVTIKATAGPVTFGDTKEGMFGLRVASSMDVKRKQGGRVVNAEGITDNEAWGKPSPWVDYSGPVAGKTVGVAILNHPSSFRYPTTWHVRDYGLFAANPFGYGDFKSVDAEGAYTLPAGESMTFRYRLILHEGRADEAHIADFFAAYAEAPKVRLTTD